MSLKLPSLERNKSFLVMDNQSDFFSKLTAKSAKKFNPKLKLNPLKVLEPRQKKLHSLEAQRIIGVLDEAKLKCSLIIILRYVMKDLRKFETLLGPELTELLRTHAERLSHFHSVEQVYLDLSPIQSEAASAVSSSVNTRQSSRVDESLLNPFILDRVKDQLDTMVLPGYGSVRSSVVDSNFHTDYSKLRATQTVLELNKLKVDLEFSVRNILREFRNREETMVRLIAECNQGRTREGAFFMLCLTDLKELILQRLLVPPTEQNDKLVYLSQIAAQQKINQSEIDQLEAELQKGIAERDKEVKARNDIIHHLQMNLQMLEKTTDEDIKRVNNEADKQKHADNKASQVRKDRMQTELKSLSYILDNDVIEHREEERLLRMKKYKIECEIENWIQKFDVEMAEKQKEYEEIDAAYQEEKAQLTELEQRFNTLESEYKEIMKLKLLERQRAEEKNRLWQRQTHAVVIIQALWRAYKVRTSIKLKTKQKNKKKKGKGNKKAKK